MSLQRHECYKNIAHALTPFYYTRKLLEIFTVLQISIYYYLLQIFEEF